MAVFIDWSAKDIKKLIRLYLGGTSRSALGKLFNCSDSAIIRILELNDITLKKSTVSYVGITGKRFTNLLVISKVVGKENVYTCLCDCGNQVVVSASLLVRGRNKSCGCLRGKATKKQFSDEEVSIRACLNSIRMSAKNRNIVLDLNREQILVLFKQDCYYCGTPPSNTIDKGLYYYSGIDRIDSNRGYILDNVVACCKICNYAKRTLSYEEFVSWINKAAKHLSTKIHKELLR